MSCILGASDINERSILYVVSDDWYFCSHRLPIAVMARDNGFRVHVICNINKHAEEIERLGFNLIPMALVRNSLNPFQFLFALFKVGLAVREIRPSIIHGIAAKPIILAIFASFSSDKTKIIGQLPGLGVLAFYRFKGLKKVGAGFLYFFIVQLFKRIMCSVIVQNSDDYCRLKRAVGQGRSSIHLVKGSGVDTNFFLPTTSYKKPKSVALVSRMIETKGIEDFVDAAKIVWKKNKSYRFLLVGDTDHDNSQGIQRQKLLEYSRLPNVLWRGYVSDVREIWEECSVACLPTRYPEGIPMSLLEAASCGRPIVASDVPGCCEIVMQGHNGFVVPQKDPESLAAALLTLLEDDDLCVKFGMASRSLVIENFDRKIIESETLEIYRLVQNY